MRFTLTLILLWPLLCGAEQPGPTDRAPSFDRLLEEAGMRWAPPEDFVETDVQPNPLFVYDHAVRDPEGRLEIRVAVRPLGRIQVDYDDPHGSAPDPNHMFPLMFQSLVTSLSGGGHSPVNEFPPAQAAERFNAQWASASVFDVVAEFAPGHGQALLVAMHRNRLADGYAVFLFDDYAAAKPLIDAHLGALSFKP